MDRDRVPELLDHRYEGTHWSRLWLSSDASGPPSFKLRGPKAPWKLDERFVPRLEVSGLLPFARMLCDSHNLALDGSLLSALVDRWRPETHTFHFRWGEMTITLQDVAMITGLPISGEAIVPAARDIDWRQHLSERFNSEIPRTGTGVLAKGVPLVWLRRFDECPEDVDDARACQNASSCVSFVALWLGHVPLVARSCSVP